MSNNASGLPPSGSRGRGVGAANRHGRHLQLVTESWIAELADLAVLPPRSGRGASVGGARVVRIVDRDLRRAAGPPSPA
jgi:hypothetical protein